MSNVTPIFRNPAHMAQREYEIKREAACLKFVESVTRLKELVACWNLETYSSRPTLSAWQIDANRAALAPLGHRRKSYDSFADIRSEMYCLEVELTEDGYFQYACGQCAAYPVFSTVTVERTEYVLNIIGSSHAQKIDGQLLCVKCLAVAA